MFPVGFLLQFDLKGIKISVCFYYYRVRVCVWAVVRDSDSGRKQSCERMSEKEELRRPLVSDAAF